MIRRRLSMLTILLLVGNSCSQAWWDDWEVETFMRYRIDNFDNNNNGYVDVGNDATLLDGIERLSVADAVEHKSTTLSIPVFQDGYRAIMDLFESPAPATVRTSARSESSTTKSSASNTGSSFGVPLPLDSSNASFDGAQPSSFTRTYSQYRGVMLEKGISFRNQGPTERTDWQRNSWDLTCGVRFADQLDSMSYSSDSLLGGMALQNKSHSEKVGPYLGLKWTTQKQKWSLTTGGRLQYAFDTSRSYHDLSFPQAISSPPSYVFGSIDRSEAMLGELQILFTLPLSEKIDVGLGYSGYFLGQIVNAAGAYDFVPPDHLYQDPAVNVAAGVAFATIDVRR